jgi:hypothetical protein
MWIIYLFYSDLIVQILTSEFLGYVVYLCYLLKCGMWVISKSAQINQTM